MPPLRLRTAIGHRFLASLIALLTLTSNPLPLWALDPLVRSPLLAQTSQTQVKAGAQLLEEGLALLNQDQPQLKEALEKFQQALNIFQASNFQPGEGYALLNLGLIYLEQNEDAKALKAQQQALQIAQAVKIPDLEGRALFNLGVIAEKQQDFDRALAYYQQSLSVSRTAKEPEIEVRSLAKLGDVYAVRKNFQQAIQSYEQSLVLVRPMNNRGAEAELIAKIGDAYMGLNDYPRMLDYYKRLLPIARELQAAEFELLVLSQVGFAYRELGDTKQAFQFLEQGLTLARNLKDMASEARILGFLGDTYRLTGEYAKGIEFGEQSLKLARQIKERAIEQSALLNLGNIHGRIGEYQQAIDRYQQSLLISREIKDRREEAVILSNLGEVYRQQKKFEEATQVLQQSLKIVREENLGLVEGNVLINLGVVALAQENTESAINYFQQVLKSAERIENYQQKLLALANLSIIYVGAEDYRKAAEYSKQSLAIIRATKDRWAEGIVLNILGLSLWALGDLSGSETALREAVMVQESVRVDLSDSSKVTLFEQQTNVFHNLQRVLIGQNKPEAALEIAERGRARAFVELLARRVQTSGGLSTTLNQPVKPIQIADIRRIAKEHQATLVQYSVVQGVFKIKGKNVAKDALLYIWVVKPTGEVSFRYVDIASLWQKENLSLAELVKTSRSDLGVRGRLTFQESTALLAEAERTDRNQTLDYQRLQTLHRLLIAPIVDLLPRNADDRVIFIPQAELFLVPFAALQDPQGQFLIEKHTIVTAPSIQVLDLTRQQRQRLATLSGRSKDVLIVGNPTMPSIPSPDGSRSEPLASLPGAEQEVKEIANLLQAPKLLGNQATKAAVKAKLPQARLIHLATHGLLDDFSNQGIPGAIALAPSGQDQGLLTADEILSLNLNADLVVLSACDTGRGRITGDGVIGLSRSLITAGAPSVVVSLWKVPDTPTAFLMTRFYQNLQKNPDKAQALRQAMLATKAEYPDPKAWAGFTLIGEAN